MNITEKMIGWAVFLIVGYNCVSALNDIDENWDKKIRLQRQNNYQVTTSQQQWEELSKFRSDWVKYFDEEKGASTSRHELFKRLKLDQSGLTPSITKIVNSESETLSHNDIPVELSKTCVGNTANGLVVKAENIGSMLDGLKRLRGRQSVVFGDLTLINKDGYPEVIIRDLCVLFRLSGAA